jgi:hypothetical protein
MRAWREFDEKGVVSISFTEDAATPTAPVSTPEAA